MSDPLDVLLLFALPASGKSEVRRYLAGLTPDQCRQDLHLAPTVQLDDYPYVHMMRRVSQEAAKRGRPGVLFDADHLPMNQPLDWGTLIELLNDDFDDLVHARRRAPPSAAAWLFDRFDDARRRVGAEPLFAALPQALVGELAAALEPEAAALLRDKNAEVPDTLAGRTVVIEAARGGPEGATPPLAAPFGYQYSLSRLSDAILARAAILYVWVTPEESRRKNHERTDPNDPGSILHHGVPEVVMRQDYGCDDMGYLIETSDRPGYVPVDARGRRFHLPIARFDNRVDRTTFVRGEKSAWPPADVAALHTALSGALTTLARAGR